MLSEGKYNHNKESGRTLGVQRMKLGRKNDLMGRQHTAAAVVCTRAAVHTWYIYLVILDCSITRQQETVVVFFIITFTFISRAVLV